MPESRPTATPSVGSNQRGAALAGRGCFSLARCSRSRSSTRRAPRACSPWFFSRYAARAGLDIGSGPSPRIVFPSSGPHGRYIVGYSRLPEFTHRLRIARLSDRRAGADVRGYCAACRSRHGAAVSREGEWRSRGPRCKRGGDVRCTTRKTALRALRRTCRRLSSRASSSSRTASCWEPKPRQNPALEWERIRAGIGCCTVGEASASRSPPKVAARSPRSSRSPPLARWAHVVAVDKLRQVAAASLRAYRTGPDTARRGGSRPQVRELDAALCRAGHGEVTASAKVWAWFGLDFVDVRAASSDRDVSAAENQRVQGGARAALRRARADEFLAARAALERAAHAYTRKLLAAGVLTPDSRNAGSDAAAIPGHHCRPLARALRARQGSR